MSDGATTFGVEKRLAPSGRGEFVAWRASSRLAGGLRSRLRHGSYPAVEFDTHRDLQEFFNSLLVLRRSANSPTFTSPLGGRPSRE